MRSLTGWEVRPNFHFGHFQRGYCWTCNECELDDYVATWVSRIAPEQAVLRADWDRYWAWLEHERIACPGDCEREKYFGRDVRKAFNEALVVFVGRRASMSATLPC